MGCERMPSASLLYITYTLAFTLQCFKLVLHSLISSFFLELFFDIFYTNLFQYIITIVFVLVTQIN